MRVLFHPRDPNPYQERLRAALSREGVRVGYLPERTGSHTLNVALLPVELVLARLGGVRLLHLHWVYRFALPGSPSRPWLRRAARAWFGLVLGLCRILRIRVVWTAHNLLPHTQVFPDDAAARRALLAASAGVIVHTDDVRDAVAARGWPLPERTVTIPHGAMVEPAVLPPRDQARQRLGLPPDARVVGMVGHLTRYKRPDRLLEAARRTPGLTVVLAGACADDALRDRLLELSADEPRLRVRPGSLTESEFADHLRAFDVMARPFAAATTSGSALAALGAGTPLLLPRGVLPELDGGVLRYADLESALAGVVALDADKLDDLRAAAAAAAPPSWELVGTATAAFYRDVLA